MSDLSRWFPLAVMRTPRSVFDPVDAWGDFAAMDRQMRKIHHLIGRMSDDFQRMTPPQVSGCSPMDLRLADEALARDPIVTDENGQKQMQMSFDVRSFKPDEISVRTKDGKVLEVDAKHDEETEHARVHRTYHRRFTIPAGVNAQDMKSMLNPDGILCITAPVKEEAPAAIEQKERPIAITHE